MRLLLDTHIYIWVIQDDAKLTEPSRVLIRNADAVFVSSASIWELAIKPSLGKLAKDVAMLSRAIRTSGFAELPVTVAHAVCVRDLPLLHRDPFDRIRIAQAMVGPLRLLTADRFLKR